MLSEVILLILLSVLFIGSYIKSESNNKTVSAVIPAFNESKTLKHVIDTVKQVPEIQEIIVVDDGSSDNTFEIAKNEGVIALQHKKNKGKGSAMKTGLKSVHGDIVLFLDADLSKINKSQVKAIIEPILKGNADITKTKFKREAGRVTELTAKPLLQFFFPELSFEQPLSGQFAAIKTFLDKIDLERDYGVDIGIVLDADAQGMRIEEVDIGDIVHEMSTLQELNSMANEVVRTIVDKAMNYGRITMMDDLGSAIRMEIMGLSLITLGLFGIFFIKFMSLLVSVICIIVGLIISFYYIIGIIRTSIKIYRQSKVSTKQSIKSFIHMHFPVLISIFILLAVMATLLGAVNISDNQISIEPASKNLVISTTHQQSQSSLDIRGPYTIESALENEQYIIRMPEAAIDTLQVNYGDSIYINGEKYQIEQPATYEDDFIRIPEAARSKLDLTPGTVIRDTDLRSTFKDCAITKTIAMGDNQDQLPPPNDTEGSFNSTHQPIDFNNTNMSVGVSIGSTQQPEKLLKVFVNDTLVGQTDGVVTNGSYNIYINGVHYKTLQLNGSTIGDVYNTTYENSTIKVQLYPTNSNTTNYFSSANGEVRFLNIHLNDTSTTVKNSTSNNTVSN